MLIPFLSGAKRRLKPMSLLLSLLLAQTSLLQASTSTDLNDELPRRASWQAKLSFKSGIGSQVKQLEPNTPLAKAGLKAGDILLKMNERILNHRVNWDDMSDALVANKTYKVSYLSQGVQKETNATFDATAKETHKNLVTEYGVIQANFGPRQRTIVTFPTKANQK